MRSGVNADAQTFHQFAAQPTGQKRQRRARIRKRQRERLGGVGGVATKPPTADEQMIAVANNPSGNTIRIGCAACPNNLALLSITPP